MHKEILSQEQVTIFPLMEKLVKGFGLVGGTALALQIGHRQSIDFDFFSLKPFNNIIIKRKIARRKKIVRTLINRKDEYTISIQGVKITFFYYPFPIDFDCRLNKIKMADILTIAAMKAYALGARSKWKDYVDLFFIMKYHYSFTEIINAAKRIFKSEFNEKLFRTQLAYFKDINYSESIQYLPGQAVSDKIIKQTLTKISIK